MLLLAARRVGRVMIVFFESRLDEIESQIYGFYCPNRLSTTLDGFFCTEHDQNANLNLNFGL